MVDYENAIAFRPCASHSGAHGQKNRRSANDRLCVAIAMRRHFTDCGPHRRRYFSDGGKTMKKIKQTLTPQDSATNAESRIDSSLDVGQGDWALDIFS